MVINNYESLKYWVWHKTDLLSMLYLISNCSKYIKKCPATMLDIGDPTANRLDSL